MGKADDDAKDDWDQGLWERQHAMDELHRNWADEDRVGYDGTPIEGAEFEHWRFAHQRNVLDKVADWFLGSNPECTHPGCPGKADEEKLAAAQPESWWERWFRSPRNGDDGESGSSD